MKGAHSPLFGNGDELKSANATITRLRARVLELELEALGDLAIRGKLRDARGRFVKRIHFENALRRQFAPA